jgi:putative glycerol-1-phosphate prenyltransferase
VSVPFIKKSGIETISTGYMIIDGGSPTTVSYISNALPIPHDKSEIALCTAMAGEMLGMKIIFMDAGSGARRSVPNEMISKVSENISIPLIIGGGIITPDQAFAKCKAGADVIVVGNAIEKDASLIKDMAAAVHSVYLAV